jgi:D-alanine--D-alanine ligase (EC 6.3.2.4)
MPMRRRITDPKGFGRVAVLMGGWSSEREVSLWSGRNVLDALTARGVDAHGVDCDRATLLGLGAAGYDRVFNVMHGGAGEDGTVQAVLDLLELSYPGCGVLASALAMDKLRSKRIWRAEGLPTPDYRPVATAAELRAAGEALGWPLFVKPVADGSSVGVVKVREAAAAEAAFATARGDGRAVMAEALVDGGGEFTCAILDGVALPLIRIVPDGEFYDYHAKYVSEQTRYQCPAELPAARSAELQEMCRRAFALLGGRGWGRIDFMLDAAGDAWLIEANTLPGMTSHSLVPMAARASGIEFPELCWTILETSLGGTP